MRSYRAMRRRGSSLILVTLIIAGIIVVVFGAHRLTLVQFNQANRDEDKLLAYYGAKAAIEDGLIRYRYHRNVETPAGSVDWVNLTNFQKGERLLTDAITDVASYDSQSQYYDLNIAFRTAQIGDFNFDSSLFNLQPPPVLRITPAPDNPDSLEISGFEPSANPYYLRVAVKFYKPGTQDTCTNSAAFVQIQQIVEGSTTPYRQYSLKLAQGIGGVVDSRLAGGNYEVNPISTLSSVFRFRPYHCDVAYALTTSTAGSGQGNDGAPKFGSLETVVTATGYFGEAKRTLQAKIDRQTGRLIRILDFNLYSGEGNIQP